MNEGWISLHRKITEHWIWSDPIKLKWWLDLLLYVNHSGKKINIGNDLFECKRGQSIMSLQNWAKRWMTSKSTVKRFFDLLEDDNMIVMENLTKTTRITICSYDDYQDSRNESETAMKRRRNADETQADTNNNDNNDNNENKDNNEINNSFELFFDEYHKVTKLNKADKAAALKKWKTLTVSERTKALENISDYYNSLSDKKYCKKARTYLNDKNFNDEFSSPMLFEDNVKPQGKIRQ